MTSCLQWHSWHVPLGVAQTGIIHVHVGASHASCQPLCRWLCVSGMTDSQSMWLHNSWRYLPHPSLHSVWMEPKSWRAKYRFYLQIAKNHICNSVTSWEIVGSDCSAVFSSPALMLSPRIVFLVFCTTLPTCLETTQQQSLNYDYPCCHCVLVVWESIPTPSSQFNSWIVRFAPCWLLMRGSISSVGGSQVYSTLSLLLHAGH